MMRAVVAVGVLMLGVTAVIAQQDQLKETQDHHERQRQECRRLAAIVKGEKPYDQATVDTALAQFDDTAKKLPKLFPASLKGKAFEGDYSTSDEDLGRQGRLRRAHRKLRQGGQRCQGQDQGSRYAEGGAWPSSASNAAAATRPTASRRPEGTCWFMRSGGIRPGPARDPDPSFSRPFV